MGFAYVPGGFNLHDNVAEVPQVTPDVIHADENVGPAFETYVAAYERHVQDELCASRHQLQGPPKAVLLPVEILFHSVGVGL